MKRYLLGAMLALLLLLAFLAAAPQAKRAWERGRLEPEAVLGEALMRMGTLEDFSYQVQGSFTVDGRREEMSDVEGVCAAGRVHIWGELVKTPVDIYYIDGTVYNYDASREQWMIVESGKNRAAELYVNELHPLGFLDFAENHLTGETAFEPLDGQDCMVIWARPVMRDESLSAIWGDFQCKLWVDYRDRVVRRAEFSAVNRSNEATVLEVAVSFSRFDTGAVVEAPEV